MIKKYCRVMACWSPAVGKSLGQSNVPDVELCRAHLAWARREGLALDWCNQLVCAMCWGRPSTDEPCPNCGQSHPGGQG